MGPLTARVKKRALGLGFDLVRITTAEDFDSDRKVALQRIDQGYMDGLPWFHEGRVNRGASPRELLPGAQSIICLALNYFPDADESAGISTTEPSSTPQLQHTQATSGQVARYARGADYHRVIKRMMRALVADLEEDTGAVISARWYVDDGPMLDRAAAARAGLGWFGKNTNILTPELGSWVFLGQVITDLPLIPDAPLQKSCGSCVRCIDACPTGAIVAPYVVDNARCISYQTIENRGPIPLELRPLMLDWVFGCDICQEVCPVNRKSRPTSTHAFQRQGLASLDLIELLEMSEAQFLERFAGTPIMRAKLTGMQRNACVALGNAKDPAAIPALVRAFREGAALVRCHAAWALGQIGGADAISALEETLNTEGDPDVLAEVAAALEVERTTTMSAQK